MSKSIMIPPALIGAMVLLSACSPSVQQAAPKANAAPSNKTLAIQAECQLLNEAFRITAERENKQVLSIVNNCPGFENAAPNSGTFREAALFNRASSASLPYDAKVTGKTATRIFQRMIARGTPPIIAEELTRTSTFSNAVATAKRI